MRPDFLEKPKGYWHWFKQVLRMCFPMSKDFYGVGEALLTLGRCIGLIIARTVILLLAPISIPLLTTIFTRQNKRTMEWRANWLTQTVDGHPPRFTREDVDSILNGEKTMKEVVKEKERMYD